MPSTMESPAILERPGVESTKPDCRKRTNQMHSGGTVTSNMVERWRSSPCLWCPPPPNLHQEGQGRSGERGREPGHPHELQGGVSPGGRPQHQGTARIWKINFAPNLSFSGQGGSYWLLLSNYWNFLFGTEPLLSSLFLFWRIDWQGGLAPKDLSTDRVLLFQKLSTPNCRFRYHHPLTVGLLFDQRSDLMSRVPVRRKESRSVTASELISGSRKVA